MIRKRSKGFWPSPQDPEHDASKKLGMIKEDLRRTRTSLILHQDRTDGPIVTDHGGIE